MMPRREGEVTPRQAARILGVHTVTVRRWCLAAVAGEPGPLPRSCVRVTVASRPNGRRFWLQRAAVTALENMDVYE